MRFTPTPVHSDAQISDLIAALKELWVACPVGKGQYIKARCRVDFVPATEGDP
jgi:hypothetical protein